MSLLRLGALLVGVGVAAGGGAVAWRATHAERASASPWSSPSAVPSTSPATSPQDLESLNAPYDGRVHFARIRYTPASRGGFGFGRRGGREPMWAHDYPRGERNFMKILEEATLIRPLVDGSNILALDDPRLFLYPIAYIVEVGSWEPTEPEVTGLRAYLGKGGFLIVDDFREFRNLQSFAAQMERVLPGVQLIELDGTHEIFDSFFRIDPHQVIPPYGPETPVWYGIFEENDRDKRLMVIVNYDNDISEYWEYSDMGFYPIDLSNEAYKLGVNYFIYALTH